MIEIILFITVLGSAFLRLFNLTNVPQSLFGDEVDVGYHAWSLITTGRDYMGHFLPSYIQSLSEWRAPLLMYLTAPFVGLFGPSVFSVRLPVAIVGTLSVLFIYVLTKLLTNDKKTAIFSAILLATLPWHIHYSRAAFEVVPLIFLIIIGSILFVKGKYFASLIPFSLTFYTYSTANVFTPLFCLGLLFFFKPKLNLIKNWPRLLTPFLICLPITYNLIFGQVAGRFGLISIFNDQKMIDSLIIQRTDPWVKQSKIETLFHNKYLGYLTSFTNNYFSAFSTQFLFANGDPYFRHSVSMVGEMYWIEAPLLLFGLYFVLKKLKKPECQLLLYWLLISPIPSSLTQSGGNHATRLFLMVPPLVIISAIGGFGLFSLMPKKIALYSSIVFFALLALSLVVYFHRYVYHYRFESVKFWDEGYNLIFSDLSKIDSNYDKIYINNTAQPSLLRFAFFTKLTPALFQQSFVTDDQNSYKSELFNGFQFGKKYYFGQINNTDKMVEILTDKTLYLAIQGREIPGDWDWTLSPPAGINVLGVEKDVFGKPLFYLLAGKNQYNK